MLAHARRGPPREGAPPVEGDRQADDPRPALRQVAQQAHGLHLRGIRHLGDVVHRAARHTHGIQRRQPVVARLGDEDLGDQRDQRGLVAHAVAAPGAAT